MRKETLAKMSTIKLDHISSLLLLFLFVLGLTIGGQTQLAGTLDIVSYIH
jgi:hypothetical protein